MARRWTRRDGLKRTKTDAKVQRAKPEDLCERLRQGAYALAMAENACLFAARFAGASGSEGASFYSDLADSYLDGARDETAPAYAALASMGAPGRNQLVRLLRSQAATYRAESRQRDAGKAGTLLSVSQHLEVMADGIVIGW